MKHNLIIMLLCMGMIGIAACDKDNGTAARKDADITAEIILQSGEKVDFSYTMDEYDFFHGPDEEGNGYIIQLYPRATIDGTWYSIMIYAGINGAGKEGEGTYSFQETLGKDTKGLFVRVGFQPDPDNITTLNSYSSKVGNSGGLVITSFSDHHIAGTFSGVMASQISDEDPPVTIKNGKFEFDF